MAKKETLGRNAVPKIKELVKELIDDKLKDYVKKDNSVNGLLSFWNSLPEDDGAHYAILNRKAELIADDGELVYTGYVDTALTLALKALSAGRFEESMDEGMTEEVKTLLGEELFDELAANSVTTVEETEEISDTERLEMAKAGYYAMKAERAKALAEAEEVTAEEIAERDVEKPSKGESI